MFIQFHLDEGRSCLEDTPTTLGKVLVSRVPARVPVRRLRRLLQRGTRQGHAEKREEAVGPSLPDDRSGRIRLLCPGGLSCCHPHNNGDGFPAGPSGGERDLTDGINFLLLVRRGSGLGSWFLLSFGGREPERKAHLRRKSNVVSKTHLTSQARSGPGAI